MCIIEPGGTEMINAFLTTIQGGHFVGGLTGFHD